MQSRMAECIRLANDRIFKESENRSECRGMGCTISAIMVSEEIATIGSVGDTRVYLFRDGHLTQLTQDDSVVAKLHASGAITEEQTRSHPMRNVLTQSLGTRPTVDIQILEIALVAQDRLLVCSDGLHPVIGDAAVRDILAATPEPALATDRLVTAARDAGGPDNISCIVIDYESQG
jgi:protein phosphatase